MRTRANTLAGRARRIRFQRLVERAMRSLPSSIRDQLENIEIVVESEPTAEQNNSQDSDANELFGLYEGIPKGERGSSYSMVTPDRIVIFQGPLERAFVTPEAIAEEVRITLLHEIAHYFGFDEDQIDELGLG